MLQLSALPIAAITPNFAELQANGAGDSQDITLFAALLAGQNDGLQASVPAASGKGGKLLPELLPDVPFAASEAEATLPPPDLATIDIATAPEPVAIAVSLAPPLPVPVVSPGQTPDPVNSEPASPKAAPMVQPPQPQPGQAAPASAPTAPQQTEPRAIPPAPIAIPVIAIEQATQPLHPAQTVRLRPVATTRGAASETSVPITSAALPAMPAAQRELLTVETPSPAAPLLRDALPTTVAPAPVTAPTGSEPPRVQDFAALVDRLVQAREAAGPQPVQLALAHAEFGRVSLRFDQDESGLNVAMSSADPGFARAVTAALPPVQPSPSSDSSQPRGEPRSEQGSAQSDTTRGQSGERREGRSDARPEQGRPLPKHQQNIKHDGIFA